MAVVAQRQRAGVQEAGRIGASRSPVRVALTRTGGRSWARHAPCWRSPCSHRRLWWTGRGHAEDKSPAETCRLVDKPVDLAPSRDRRFCPGLARAGEGRRAAQMSCSGAGPLLAGPRPTIRSIVAWVTGRPCDERGSRPSDSPACWRSRQRP